MCIIVLRPQKQNINDINNKIWFLFLPRFHSNVRVTENKALPQRSTKIRPAEHRAA